MQKILNLPLGESEGQWIKRPKKNDGDGPREINFCSRYVLHDSIYHAFRVSSYLLCYSFSKMLLIVSSKFAPVIKFI
jgi:hypothetical protein